MKWSNEYKIHYYYTDYNNVLKPSYIARYMQETAWNALKNWGPTPEYLKEHHLAFILTKISFKYYNEIYEDDTIKIETWPNPPKTIIFPRHYRITKDGETMAEAVSAWVMMNFKEKSIVRPDDYKDVLNVYDDEELAFNVQRRIKMPEDVNGFDEYEYKVRYSDIDTNFHMNNAAYIDLICDSLYSDGDMISPDLKKRILSLDLNYNSEARFAQTIEMSKGIILSMDEKTGKETEEHYIKAKVKNDEQNCFEAKIVLTNVDK